MKRVTYNGLEFEPYITRDMIASRVGELARQITQDFVPVCAQRCIRFCLRPVPGS